MIGVSLRLSALPHRQPKKKVTRIARSSEDKKKQLFHMLEILRHSCMPRKFGRLREEHAGKMGQLVNPFKIN